MPALKDVRFKIKGIKKTQQITKAMNMVAASKLRGAQTKMEGFSPYADKFSAVMSNLSGSVNPSQFPLMAQRQVKKILVIVVTSDKGLCGAFNANIINAVNRLNKEIVSQGKSLSLICVGRKAVQFFKKSNIEVVYNISDIMSDVQIQFAKTIGQQAITQFLSENFDEVQLVYGKFINVAVQRPIFKKILPLSKETLVGQGETSQGTNLTYTFEPEPDAILNNLLPLYVNIQIMSAMLETVASEQASRMTSMDNATRACKDMLGSLTLIYNKARQATITKELMDIVGGAEALKG
jgi:F-type H+-transporting ATPase subunit gamma